MYAHVLRQWCGALPQSPCTHLPRPQTTIFVSWCRPNTMLNGSHTATVSATLRAFCRWRRSNNPDHEMRACLVASQMLHQWCSVLVIASYVHRIRTAFVHGTHTRTSTAILPAAISLAGNTMNTMHTRCTSHACDEFASTFGSSLPPPSSCMS